MAVMKDRLSRGFHVRFFVISESSILNNYFQTFDSNESSISKFDQFKRCFRDRAKYEKVVAHD